MTATEQLYERMYFIRRFEETLLDLFSAGKLVGTTHTYIGQEANATGIIAHLDPDRDVVFSNHRCHGHYLAFTDDAYGLLCEVMGRADGVCGGKGGSQHLCNGNFYSNGVLGSIVPVATGIALQIAGDITARAEAFGIETAHLDTTDVAVVEREAAQVVQRVRDTGRPFFLVIDTYRFSPHSKGDDIRDPAEIEERRELDPLLVAGARLDEATRGSLERACEERLAEVVDRALAAEAA